VETAK
jgi:hypothetical protein